MARLLATGDTDHILATTGGWVDPPFSLSIWGKAVNNTANCYVSISDADGTHQHGLIMTGVGGGFGDGYYVGAFSRSSGAGHHAVSASATSAGVWHQAGGVWADASHRTAYINGAAGTENVGADTITASNMDVIDIGRLGDSTPNWYFDGDEAEFGAWDVALTDAEMAILALGVSPRFVRPQNLIYYLPLIGTASPEIELIQGVGGVLTNTTKSHHPRIINPTAQVIPFPPAAAPPAGGGLTVGSLSLMGVGI